MPPDADTVARLQSFYGRFTGLFDRVATLPGVGRYRTRAVDALELSPGDTVVELGCGTGGNLPLLAEAVGPDGTVLGVDVTAEMLAVARERTADLPQVEVCRAEATRPPVGGAGVGTTAGIGTADVDGVLASFLVGMLPDPAAAVDEWLALVGPDGRVALLDAAPTRGPAAGVLNPLLGGLARLGAPPGSAARAERSLAATLADRVGAAHDRLRLAGREPTVERPLGGFVWCTAGAGPGRR